MTLTKASSHRWLRERDYHCNDNSTDKNTNDFAFPVRGKWMMKIPCLYLLIAVLAIRDETP
jgi:hypothetical protein